MLPGTGASPGAALGPAALYRQPDLRVPGHAPKDVAAELLRLEAAVAAVLARVEALEASLDQQGREIFAAHRQILGDRAGLLEPMAALIRDRQMNAAQAVEQTLAGLEDALAALEDPYLRERAADFRDLKIALLCQLLGLEPPTPLPRGDCILVARDLTPSQTAELDPAHVLGIATQEGGPQGHTAILARSLGIPAVVGVADLLDQVREGALTLVDGDRGFVWPNPSREELDRYARQAPARGAPVPRGPAATADGHRVLLGGNIGLPREAAAAAEQADFLGLVRSEFLYLGRSALPGEEELVRGYREILQAMGGRPVTVRTLDAGGDKCLPGLSAQQEDNPALGLRGIRLSLRHKDLFLVQLRALLRAAPQGELRIMFPMVAALEELREAKAALEEARRSLAGENIPFGPWRVGMMVETPAAALLAESFAPEVEFFSIGTNDLTQYTLAADRTNPRVGALYDCCHPAVLRLVRHTLEAAQGAGIPCCLCGEAAADPLLTPLWLGLGLEELSLAPPLIPGMRQRVSRLHLADCRAAVPALLALPTADEVRRRLGELFPPEPAP